MKLKLTNLTRVAATTVASLFFTFSAAQTFTQRVQQQRSGEGTVTIHQDADIDRLINGNTARVQTPPPTSTPAKAKNVTTAKKPTATPETPKAEKTKAEKNKAEKPKAGPQADTAKAGPQTDTAKARPQTDTAKARPQTDTAEADTVATTTTTPRHSYKTTGYRVQAFAGGNTRNDRQKAERTGNAMRQLLPGEDVYVRFYSPRWVCRVGNYRTYEEAREKMLLIRKLGYETATIVKGKIIVYHD